MSVAGVVQEDGFGLEYLIATSEAEQRGERVSGCEECDDEDGQHRLGELELRVFRIEAWEYEVAGAQAVSFPFQPSSAGMPCDIPSQYHPRGSERYEAPVPGRRLVDIVL